MPDSWQTPSRARKPSLVARSLEQEDLSTRILAVVVAVPVFELSLYFGLTGAFFSPRVARYAFLSLPLGFHLVYLLVAMAVGLAAGMSGLTRLLGHLFATHPQSERDIRITAALWSALAVATCIAYTLGRR